MQKPVQIGITGGIGAGKSVVCKIFKVLKVPTYDADSRAKAVMTTDGILIDAIKKEFGTLSFTTSGQLNREYLSKEVFSDEKKLEILNTLVHPRVALDYEIWLNKQAGHLYVMKEAALLFESGTHKMLDKVLLVSAPISVRIQRVLLRDPHRTEEQVKNIMKNQWKEEERVKHADYRIDNDEQHSLIDQSLRLHEVFVGLAKKMD